MTGQPRASVLVVDHDRWTRSSVSAMLTEAGFSVFEASNGMTALRVALAEAPHAVVIGRELPEMCGSELTESLRSDPRTKHTGVVTLHNADVADADASVALQYNALELLAAVENAFEARR